MGSLDDKEVRNRESTSKFLSLVLRHKPEEIGLELDGEGWAWLDELVLRSGISREEILEIVRTSDKQRFALSDDASRIRANQGHSLAVDLGLQAMAPPELLYHGTATRFVESIRRQGLLPVSRQLVHLSATRAAAIEVGRRHGKPIVLLVRAMEMVRDGRHFYRSANGVWLTEEVPAGFLEFPSES